LESRCSVLILARDINEVSEKFDFTDSIITKVSWENSLFDLVLVIDYWWDLDEDTSSEKGYGTTTLKMTLSSCIKAEFNNNHMIIELPKSEIHADSWFTIVAFRNRSSSDKLTQIEICTTDLATPWLSASFKEIIVEKI
jgi:hypothetical protein